MPRNMNLHFVNSTESWIYFTYKTKTGTFNNNGKGALGEGLNYYLAYNKNIVTIMYLFEDVMKMRPENIFIGHNKKNGKMIFSEICKAFEQDGEGIFGIEDLVNI